MIEKVNSLWSVLSDADIVSANSHPPSESLDNSDSPWYVKTLLGLSGWVAALFLFLFIGFLFESLTNSFVKSSITGIVLLLVAFIILRIPKNEFFEHLGLAISMAGQGFLIFTVFYFNKTAFNLTPWLLVALLNVTLAVIMPSFVHRVLSACFAVFTASIGLYSIGLDYFFLSVVLLLVTFLWLNEFRYPKHIKKIQAIAYGLVLGLIIIESFAWFENKVHFFMPQYDNLLPWLTPWMAETIAVLTLWYVVWQLLVRSNQSLSGKVALSAFAAALLFSVVSLFSASVTTGMVILILGFAASNRVLQGLGVVFLLYYVSTYYYYLEITLLEKSITLFVLGLVLLLMRWLLLNKLFKASESVHE